eukprot:5180624-Pleurochrysis_carterae.AAC.1
MCNLSKRCYTQVLLVFEEKAEREVQGVATRASARQRVGCCQRVTEEHDASCGREVLREGDS